MGARDGTLWGLLLAAAALEICGDLAFKWWAETNRWPGLLLGLAAYGFSLVLFALMLRRAELSVIYALWTGVAAIVLALIGWLLFKEVLSLRQVIGLALVICGIILLQM